MRSCGPPLIVSGMVAGDPYQGGAAWVVLQYVLGLKRLGYDVYLVEPVTPKNLRPSGASLSASENAAYFRAVTRAYGLQDRSAIVVEESHETVGVAYSHLASICSSAAGIINISGMLQSQQLIGTIPIRVYLDLDPGFNQLWHATQGVDMRFAAHNRFVTVGKALGKPECPVPLCGLQWSTTFQPVLLEYCAIARTIRYDAFTSVGNWRGYGSIIHDGVLYGQKAHSFRSLLDLPCRTNEQFTIALSIHPDERRDLSALSRNGWRLVDPVTVAGTPQKFLTFIGASKGELGVAKSGYITSRCGWFSDRSACYLASGRPVIAQETGFSEYLPCGNGLFRFETAEDVVAVVGEINSNYNHHCTAARAIAEEYFDSDKVLSKLLNTVGLS